MKTSHLLPIPDSHRRAMDEGMNAALRGDDRNPYERHTQEWGYWEDAYAVTERMIES